MILTNPGSSVKVLLVLCDFTHASDSNVVADSRATGDYATLNNIIINNKNIDLFSCNKNMFGEGTFQPSGILLYSYVGFLAACP